MTQISEKDVFVPKIRQDMRRTYPELARIEEFKNMRALDVKFAWYYAIYYQDEEDHDKRVKKSIQNAYHDGLNESLIKRYLSLDFPMDIKKAIVRFEHVDIGARLRAKFTSERILKGFEKLAETDVDTVGVVKIYREGDDEPIGEKRDWNQVSAFVNSMTKINESMPGLLQRAEEAYGIKTTREAHQDTGSVRDKFMTQKEEQASSKKK